MSKSVRELAFGTPKFYFAPYDKINHGLANIRLNCDVKSGLNYPKYNNVCSNGSFSLGTQERVRKSRGKRTIGVRAIEVQYF